MNSIISSLNWPILYGAAAVFAFLTAKKLFLSSTQNRLPLPPGPKGLPLIGNIRDLPPPGKPEFEHWAKFRDLYGPISSVTTFGQTIIVINDKNVALELLEKRSAKYSERPDSQFSNQMCDYNHLLSFKGNDSTFRQHRRLLASQFGSRNSITKFSSASEFQTRHFLLRTMNNPENLIANLRIANGALMLDIIYGYKASAFGHDPLLVLINKFMAEFNIATVPGTWLVDMVPWLRRLPDWFPGTGFKQIARAYRKTFHDVSELPFRFTERQVQSSLSSSAVESPRPSFVAALLAEKPDDEAKEHIKYSANALYDGGADTTVGTLGFFFLAMMLFPEVQQKAREEIDRVTGGTRLPGLQDRNQLPYIEATVKEALRWQPIGPLGLPHAISEEDEYRGYRIPKGSIVLASIDWCAKDATMYKEPDRFNPDRFLGPIPEPSPWSYVFGFGRRICPGRYLVDSTLFLFLAQSLAVFDIKKPVNKSTGQTIEPTKQCLSGIVTHSAPYEVDITPRSEKHAAWVRSIEVEQPWGDGDSLTV